VPASSTGDIYVRVCVHAFLEDKKEDVRGEKYVERQEENRIKREK